MVFLPLLYINITAPIIEYRSLFDIGLHGPDLLFYYRPLFSNPVNRIGFSIHANWFKRGIAFSKGASFIGTTLVAVISHTLNNESLGVSAIIIIFIIGFVLFCKADQCVRSQQDN